ncbi:hypothetical protein GUY60_37900 [Streptomyces sp. YC537]|uniref:Uncharacterized protein n=2 Tax=Streptomyces boluensis TaxID=1775135 RepID=A0A964UX67_9ACTN|nr:hypothetical protein [Streptomyces boluensis]
MYGGSGNTGIDKRQMADIGRSCRELADLLVALRGDPAVAPASAQVLDDALPVIASDASPVPERRRALIAVATIAATIGAVGQPIAEAANKVLGLLG